MPLQDCNLECKWSDPLLLKDAFVSVYYHSDKNEAKTPVMCHAKVRHASMQDSLSQHAQKDPSRSNHSPLLIYFTFTPCKSLQLFLVGILVSQRVQGHLAQRKFRQWLFPVGIQWQQCTLR